eukprot:1189605-Prorocentrum_minimum.AAC.5
MAGVHRNSKQQMICAIGVGAGVHQLEIFTQVPEDQVRGLEGCLRDVEWPVVRVTAIKGLGVPQTCVAESRGVPAPPRLLMGTDLNVP